MTRVLLLLTLITVAGCTHYEKPGASAADYHHDNYECERDVRQMRVASEFDAVSMKVDCMRDRGWALVRN